MPNSINSAERRRGTPRRRIFADRAARWVVTAGGLATIAAILGILLFIVVEIVPLLRPARVDVATANPVGGGGDRAVLSDEYRSLAAVLSTDGTLRVLRLPEAQPLSEHRVTDRPLGSVTVAAGQQLFTAATTDGHVLFVPVSWVVSFEGSERVVTPRIGTAIEVEVDPTGRSIGIYAAGLDDDGNATVVAHVEGEGLVVVRREVEENMFSGERVESWRRSSVPFAVSGELTAIVLDRDHNDVYAGTRQGELVWWKLAGVELGTERRIGRDGAVSALTLLLGDRSIVVGYDTGSIRIAFPVRQPDESFELAWIREFPTRAGAVRLLSPSFRDKGFLAQDSAGGLGLYYSTSARVLWNGTSPVREASSLFFTPKADGALVVGDGRIAGIDIDNPHPEISVGALFGRVWYEGYTEPELVWQSSGGTDDFEPKLSLVPLMVGTLKGTLYSLLLAIPLGVLGAMYTSQFMHERTRRIVKPTIEIMAALPSVVLGFLAGLWLAPRLETFLPGMFLLLVTLPLVMLAVGFAWEAVPPRWRGRFPGGTDLVLQMLGLTFGSWTVIRCTPAFERLVFAGDFRMWLLETTGLAHDQRNAIVVGVAMGFAVIPIIFSISEDAFSNVPRNLISGSLALGATPWQTVTQVVLPTASPGIASAVIIGFGRAVGETMIVLMATGNTPLLDWSPFNGFRTLSANIAVEIPEAPHGGTLYRTLFLAAMMLFAITFAINTAAELVRQRLRTRYARL